MATAVGESKSGDDTDERLSKDELFDLMSNHRRRYTVHYLRREDGPVSLSDLAEHVAAWELEKDVEELTSSERKTVYTSLQQTHLDRLDDAGIVTYENGTIELSDHATEIEFYLDIVPEGDIPWAMYYLGLSVLALVTVAVAAIDVVPFDFFTPVTVAIVVAIAFGVSSAVHVYLNRQYKFESFERPA